MLKKMTAFLLTVFLCAAFLPTVSALEKKDEWKDRQADFGSIKKIKVDVEWLEPAQVDEIGSRRLNDLVDDAFIKGIVEQKKDVRFTVGDIAPAIGDGEFDAFLKLKVLSLGQSKVLVPGQWKTEIIYVDEPVLLSRTDGNGNTTTETQYVRKPRNVKKFVPEHIEMISNAGMEFSLTDAKTQKKIWILLDSREAGAEKEPIGMAERILKRTVEQFLKLK